MAFGGSRTFHRIACAIEDAGFEIRDTIMWLYGSGFPKSMDISKSLDKRNGRNYNNFIEFGKYIKEKRGNISQTKISKLFPSKNGGSTGRVSNWEKGLELPNKEQYAKLKKILNLDDRYDYLIEKEQAKREIIGKGKAGLTKGTIANFAGATEFDITIPATDLAKQWQGWGTALKPSYESIIVARKPLDGTCVDNVIKWGVGGINIDECRIPLESDYQYKEAHRKPRNEDTVFDNKHSGFKSENNTTTVANPDGRFPANTILTYDDTDFEEVYAGFPQDNSGSASRYFYCAKASKRDRDEGLEEFETKQTTGGGGGIGDYLEDVNSASGKFGSEKAPHKNHHPTVKPTSLMQYLVRLVTPKGGTILDPFMGSGSTGKAVAFENKDRQSNYSFIGIEKEQEYCDIAKARIEWACKFEENEPQTIEEVEQIKFDIE